MLERWWEVVAAVVELLVVFGRPSQPHQRPPEVLEHYTQQRQAAIVGIALYWV